MKKYKECGLITKIYRRIRYFPLFLINLSESFGYFAYYGFKIPEMDCYANFTKMDYLRHLYTRNSSMYHYRIGNFQSASEIIHEIRNKI